MPLTEGLTLPVIVGAAVIDSINPCAFGVLIFILAYLLKVSKNKTKVLLDGFGYVVGVYLTYLLLGSLIFMAIGGVLETLRSTGIVNYFYQGIGAVIILAGLLELKEFMFPNSGGPHLSIMPGWAEKVKKWTKQFGDKAAKNFGLGLILAIVMGFLVALVELPCTGAPYIAVITLLTQAGFTLTQAMPLLMAYNLIFVLPLLGIIFIVYKGTSTDALKKWKESHKLFMRLAAGVMLIALGLFIFFFDVFFGG